MVALDQDLRFVQETLKGNSSAFASLVEKYYRVVYNVAVRMGNACEDAEDITQDTFVKVYEKLGTFNPKYKFFSWLYRIAINESINALKRIRSTEHFGGDEPESDHSPESEYDLQELTQRVQECLMALKVEHRIVIVLNHFEDLSYDEIGYILDIPSKTVKSRLFTARQQLKEIMTRKHIAGRTDT